MLNQTMSFKDPLHFPKTHTWTEFRCAPWTAVTGCEGTQCQNDKRGATEIIGFNKTEMSEKHIPYVSQICSSLGVGDNPNYPKCIKDMQEAKVTPIHQPDEVNQLRPRQPAKENPKEVTDIQLNVLV